MVPRAPRLTAEVLNGIVAATEATLAFALPGACKEDWSKIEAANAWAREMLVVRLARQQRKKAPKEDL
jgi:hypothetical protein